MRILISGGLGFVGRNLARHFAAQGHHVLAVGKETLNIGDEASVRSAIKAFEPDVLLNAAGDKNLQRCEDDSERAMRINAYAPAMLARVCMGIGVKFVQIGSDHAYAAPLTGYGESKRAGDEMVMHANPNSIVVVSGHIYAADCPWVKWLDGELRAGRTVEAWTDIYAWATYAPNLAAMILDLLERRESGVWTCVGGQYVDRLVLFQMYAVQAGFDADLIVPSLEPCPSALHMRGAKLPRLYSGKVRRVTVAQGMQAMCWGRLEGVAA